MILAAAALLLQLNAVVPAMPKAASAGTNAVRATVPSASATASSNASSTTLPAAPQPSTSAAPTPVESVSAAAPSGPGTSSGSALGGSTNPQAMMRVVSHAGAIDTQGLSTIRIADPDAPKQTPHFEVESLPSRRAWMALSFAQSGAAAFDAYSTRRALDNGAHEADPMMRPFAGSPGIYAAIQVGPVLLDFAARRMQRSQVGVLRHTWWLPQTVSTGIYLFSGVHNMRVAGRP